MIWGVKMYLTEEEIAIYEREVLLKEDKEILFEMTNIRKKYTGLPCNIWIDDMSDARNVKHNVPRIKFQNDTGDDVNDNLVPLSIDKENPQILSKRLKVKLSKNDFELVQQFVKNNFDVLLRHWHHEIDSFEFKDQMIPMNKKAPQ